MPKKIKVVSKDRDSRVADLENLKNDPGWLLIVEHLDKNIRALEEQLNGDGETIKDFSEMTELQSMRRDRKILKALPDKLISEYTKVAPERPDMDPYEK